MRKLKVSTLVTLDGVVQDPSGFGEIEQGGWTGPYFNDEARQNAWELLRTSDLLLCGRATYEQFKAFWPRQESEYAARMNGIPKLVASTTLAEPLEWNATLITGDVAAEIAELKQEPGDDILMYGSPTLAQSLLHQGLVDEYSIWVFPVVLGHGKRAFPDGAVPVELNLVDTKTLQTGVALLTYEPRR